jgi:hypothetical protein
MACLSIENEIKIAYFSYTCQHLSSLPCLNVLLYVWLSAYASPCLTLGIYVSRHPTRFSLVTWSASLGREISGGKAISKEENSGPL